MSLPPGFTEKDWFKKNSENIKQVPVFYLPPPKDYFPPYTVLNFQTNWKPETKSTTFPRIQ